MTVIWGGVGMGFFYGLAGKFIQAHGGYVSFAMLALIFISILGMIRTIDSTPRKSKGDKLNTQH